MPPITRRASDLSPLRLGVSQWTQAEPMSYPPLISSQLVSVPCLIRSRGEPDMCRLCRWRWVLVPIAQRLCAAQHSRCRPFGVYCQDVSLYTICGRENWGDCSCPKYTGAYVLFAWWEVLSATNIAQQRLICNTLCRVIWRVWNHNQT